MSIRGQTFDRGLRPSGPRSNLQRQREFVARHPHYYRDRRRRERARVKAALAAKQAQAQLAQHLFEAPLFAEVIQQEIARQSPALPAPKNNWPCRPPSRW